MSDNFLVDFSIDFATKIVNLTEQIQGKGVLKNQILKSGTSIGANIHEANYAQSKADFVSKLQIALKECYETEYWLKLFSKTNIIDANIYSELQNDCGKIRRVLISSINTTKEKYNLKYEQNNHLQLSFTIGKKEERHSRSLIFMYYKPNNCFFFASNSS